MACMWAGEYQLVVIGSDIHVHVAGYAVSLQLHCNTEDKFGPFDNWCPYTSVGLPRPCFVAATQYTLHHCMHRTIPLTLSPLKQTLAAVDYLCLLAGATIYCLSVVSSPDSTLLSSQVGLCVDTLLCRGLQPCICIGQRAHSPADCMLTSQYHPSIHWLWAIVSTTSLEVRSTYNGHQTLYPSKHR